MAVFTDIGRIDMIDILAAGGAAVVAAETVSGDVGMIESGRGPGCRYMAIATLIVAQNVVHRLASGLHAIVTTGATAHYLSVIYARDRTPGRFPVTVLALYGGQNMLHRHRRCFDQAGTGVTADALPGRTLKNPPYMAGGAICGSMYTLQRESG